MPSCSAARMISVPAGTVTSLPSIVSVTSVSGVRPPPPRAPRAAGIVRAGRAPRTPREKCLRLESITAAAPSASAQNARNMMCRPMSRITGRSSVAAVAVGDPAEDALRPPRPLAARRALPARLVGVEARHPLRGVDHAVRVVQDHHGPRPEQRAGRGHRLVVERRVDVVGGEQRRRRAPGRPGLEGPTAEDPAGDVLQEDPERRAERELVVARTLDLAADREELRARRLLGARARGTTRARAGRCRGRTSASPRC